ncbi:pyridoxamine 5'-phosphate oxidase family protein [Massilia sp. W12]|uniref:2Fe-2S iron-sulfur cluster-binding protein n=1 Tax=Massilia sp. W12 TaxID=3126507 RepID=UPI0030D2FE87
MPRAFATINFTDSVKAAQSQYGSREANQRFEVGEDASLELSAREIEFIQARDSFYQATVNQDGWPYVQHRGGPAGFLKVIGARTIGFADFSGNRQYLSVGNLRHNDKIALILMDYSARRRLKLWGRVRIVHESEEPELIARLEDPHYRARIERAFVIELAAWDWNCPQHITPRYASAELSALMAPVQTEMAALRAQVRPVFTELGEGPLQLTLSAMRQLTPKIRAIELRAPDGADLPPIRAGAHLMLPVRDKDGAPAVRCYSISSDPARRDVYEVAVLLQEQGQGGSAFIHQHYQLGLQLRCAMPRNHFALDDSEAPVLLLAGGIGITPLKAMAAELQAQGRPFSLHYAAASQAAMAYRDSLQRRYGERLHLRSSAQQQRIDMRRLLARQAPDTQVYVCGPARMIAAAQAAAQELGISAQLHVEHFSALQMVEERSFSVLLQRSQKTVQVTAQQSLPQALQAAGVQLTYGCGAGACGTCAVKVLAGAADHRDQALSTSQREQEKLFCPCVSRAHSAQLVLDC